MSRNTHIQLTEHVYASIIEDAEGTRIELAAPHADLTGGTIHMDTRHGRGSRVSFRAIPREK